MDEDYKKKIIPFFNNIAWFYDIAEIVLSPTRKAAVNINPIFPSTKVIDFCTGTGAVALAFSQRSDHVIGIDLSQGMLKRSQRKSEKIHFLLMDATKTTFRRHEFDVGIISFALHDMPYRVRVMVLKEMKRVCKQRIIVVDYCAPRHTSLRWLYRTFISLYETSYFKDFINRDVHSLFASGGLDVMKEQKVGLFKIYLLHP